MHTMTLDMPEDVLSVLRRSPDEFLREMRLAAAMHWYAKGLVSEEKAAEVAGWDRTDFLLALAREQIEAFPVDLAQLTEEINRERLLIAAPGLRRTEFNFGRATSYHLVGSKIGQN